LPTFLAVDMWTIGRCVLVTVKQSKHVLCSHDLREDEHEAAYKFIKEDQNCLALSDVSSAAYKDTKNKWKLKVVTKGGISADIWCHPNLSFSSPAINMK